MLTPVGFDALPGWQSDRIGEAWPALLSSCQGLRNRNPTWRTLCADAAKLSVQNEADLRRFFETRFVAHELRSSTGEREGLVTGYYEPLLQGSRTRVAPFTTPLYAVPEDLITIDLGDLYPQLKTMRLRGRLQGRRVVPYPDRTTIESQGLARARVLAWVDDPVAAFFLQVQGSGRVQLMNEPGQPTIRMGYADQNGHPYKAIGRWLVEQGELRVEDVSMQSIQAWAAANPQRRDALLNANPSYVFFRETAVSNPAAGPNGALGVPLTPERSIAIDPSSVPLGSPVWLETTRPDSGAAVQKLVMAQDTGGAIRGIVRADYFWGFGHAAGQLAGRMKQPGRMWVLLPREASSPP